MQRLLIANRGEICCRIAKTARKLGIKCVAIFSEADRNAYYLEQCDEAYFIGPAPSQDSYLNQENVLNIAKKYNIQAIHPGYGFLSENFTFAEKCEGNNIVFIGPSSKSIHDMGIKSISKQLMQRAGVPIIPGYFGENQSDTFLLQESKTIGFPVILKADYGGGGKGIRICWNEAEFAVNLQSVRNEARKAFGNEKLMVEKFIQEPKHIEVQVFGDHYGNIVTLFERDCSIQRRHQKILEEAPAAFLPVKVREKLYEYAKKAAETVKYHGAGTVEFMIDKSGAIYFMEMNTRLQVEHGITEMITGLDLVEWQLRIANGEHLPLSQSLIKSNGHAAEFRICAEDPEQNFMPSPGPLKRFVFDQNDHHASPPPNEIRLDTGVRQGEEISIYYDSMIAKLMSWAPDRELSLAKLKRALNSLYVSGVKTNIPFLNRLLEHPLINEPSKLHVDFIKSDFDKFQNQTSRMDESINPIAVIATLMKDTITKSSQKCQSEYDSQVARIFSDPFEKFKWFRVNLPLQQTISNIAQAAHTKDDKVIECLVTFLGPSTFNIDNKIFHVKNFQINSHEDLYSFTIVINGKETYQIKFVQDEESMILNFKGQQYYFTLIPKEKHYKADDKIIDKNLYLAPITGTVDKVLVKEGDMVIANQPLMIIIAMKMEYIIKALKDGKITSLNTNPGELVNRNTVLITIE